MTDQEKAEAQERLAKEAEALKARQDAGLTPRKFNVEEAIAARNASEGIISVADAMKPAIEGFAKAAERTEKFAKRLREKLIDEPPRYCEKHTEQRLVPHWDKTFSHSWKANDYCVVWAECPACRDEKNHVLVNEKYLRWGIPQKLLEATFENFGVDTESKRKARLKVMERKNGFVIIRGTYGAGKSHLASALLKENGGRFITMADLVAELRATYDGNEGQDDMVDRYHRCKCLVIDEVSTEVFDPKLKKNLDVPPLLYRILAPRYDHNLLTVLTSNETLPVILDILGPRLTDRICENYVVATCEWDSYRKRK